MNRRGIIVVLSAVSAALFAQQRKSETTTIWTATPKLMLDLDNFGGFDIKRGKELIHITPEEIWEALAAGKDGKNG